MLTEILLLLLVLVVATLMIVDQHRTRGEGTHGPADSPAFGGSALGGSAFGGSSLGNTSLGGTSLGGTSLGGPAFGGSAFGGAAFGGERSAAVPSRAGVTAPFSPEPARNVTAPPGIGPRLGSGARPGTGPVPDEVSRRAQRLPGGRAAAADADSVGDAGEAGGVFDQMRREISRLTTNEAELGSKLSAVFVNLAHRSRLLAERQIRLVENLAHGEQDERRLASLEKMSRIATQMYRSSMNLLILAGQEPSTGSSQPALLVHLVQAAVSDIEDGERVSFEVQQDVAVRGPATDDLVHLLAELMQNATSFSAANMPVRLSGHAVNTGGVVVEITDHGIGMTDKELAYANWQLENPPATTIDATKWMGLLVVARLAGRHGIKVRLNQAEQGGLTALVWLPAEILMYHAAGGPGAGPSTAAHRAPRAEPAPPPLPGQIPGAQPAFAAREDADAVLPSAEGSVATRRLPIFDEMESRWSGPGAVQTVDPPPIGGPTAPPLPTRRPTANPGGQQEH
jgi:signal transduction histidine kinase